LIGKQVGSIEPACPPLKTKLKLSLERVRSRQRISAIRLSFTERHIEAFVSTALNSTQEFIEQKYLLTIDIQTREEGFGNVYV
jgi:hypothetical protein